MGRVDPELPVALDRASPVPLTRQLEAQLRALVTGGRLLTGASLPSTRMLATRLGVSRGVVLSAYDQLAQEGMLEGRRGAGTRVRGSSPARRPAAPARRPRLDLHPQVPDLSAFPRREWQRALQAALRTLADREFGYHSARGVSELREELAVYLARTRGVVASPDQLIICGGLAQGFGFLVTALREMGIRRLLVPRVGHALVRDVLGGSSPRPRWLGVDDAGLVLDQTPATASDAVLVAPAHQFPLGSVLSHAREEALMSGNALVLEDSTDADLRPRDIARPSLQHAAPERVVHFGSVSRSLAPGLRLGWIVAPEAMVGIVARAKARSDLGPAVLEQIAFARFLAAGELDRHLRRLRLEYGQRRDALVVALAEAVPELSVHVPSIGFHLLARLPARRTEEELVGAMRANGVRVAGLAEHTLAGPPLPPTLLLGYANVPQAAAPSVASALRLALSRRS